MSRSVRAAQSAWPPSDGDGTNRPPREPDHVLAARSGQAPREGAEAGDRGLAPGVQDDRQDLRQEEVDEEQAEAPHLADEP